MKSSPAAVVMQRIEALGRISDEPGVLTRTFGSAAMRRANRLAASWMRRAGMAVRRDNIGNLIGRYPAATRPNGRNRRARAAKTLLLGSHLDTVRNAGKFDGPLGVLSAIACVQQLHDRRQRLPFAIEVIAFCDEEGVRFQSTYLGSRVLAGTLPRRDLRRADAQGVTLAQAIRAFGGNPNALATGRVDARRLLGYVEVHIEQGPVLEQMNLAVGVVSAIAGQSRFRISFTGQAGHAGTTPMRLRRDALGAAAEFVLKVEATARAKAGLVATVGEITALPGASNVIPGEVWLTLDVRHAEDAERCAAGRLLQLQAREVATQRQVKLGWQPVHEAVAVACDRPLSNLLGIAVKRRERKVLALSSGAGHDAAALAVRTPVAMLFIRCKHGLSHHPDESVKVGDVRTALAVMRDFLLLLAAEHV